jgi:hypothetical protein
MTTVLVLCGWPGCAAPELRPLDGDNYSFTRAPGRRDKWIPTCEPCRDKMVKERREALVAQS